MKKQGIIEKESQMNDVISIVVPVYKVENEIDRCVKSLLSQTYTNIEIILVDDGSPDNCPKICDDYAKKDGRVSVVHKQNGGLSDARNAGLKVATGEFILYVDSDDYIDEDACQRLIDVASNCSVDIIVGGAVVHNGKPNERMEQHSFQAGEICDAKEFIKKAIVMHEWYAPAWLNMYRRRFLLDSELYYKKGIYFEDMEMLPRVFLAANKVAVMGGTFYHYVIRKNSIMTSSRDSIMEKNSIQNLSDWKIRFDKVENKDLQRFLYGMLIRCYLHECRVYHIAEWRIPEVGFVFALKYGIGIKEKSKGLVFGLYPKIYSKV